MALAIWTAPEPTLRLISCQTVHLENITVRFGGGRSIRITSRRATCTSTISPYWPAHTALRSAKTATAHEVTNCSFDGGMPPWYFRSDRKNGYTIAGIRTENRTVSPSRQSRRLIYCDANKRINHVRVLRVRQRTRPPSSTAPTSCSAATGSTTSTTTASSSVRPRHESTYLRQRLREVPHGAQRRDQVDGRHRLSAPKPDRLAGSRPLDAGRCTNPEHVDEDERP